MTKKNCDTCEFGMGPVCMGYGKLKNGKDTYGVSIKICKKEFVNGCEDWEESFLVFQKNYNNKKENK